MNTLNKKISKIIRSSISIKQKLFEDVENINKIAQVTDLLVDAFENGNKVLFCGNGGSAADAQHLAAEFSGRFYKDRKALPSEALHCNTSFLTAVANDYGYEKIYSRIVQGVGKSGDVLIGISTSGNSENIINVFSTAKEMGITTISLTGKHGGKMKLLSNVNINVDSDDTPRIQESHILIGHIICELVEEKLFS
jgi:D-sedoheptulose 7-phosphate isomerase